MQQHPSRTGPPPALSPHEPGGPEQAGPARARRRRAAAALAMTLALTGPWAWAELSDPPPGEPTPPPPGQPSGPPTPPPPPDPPPPPEPPPPPPTLSWHGDEALIAVWDADVKLTVAAQTGENTDCGRSTAVGGNWPFSTIYTEADGFHEDVNLDWSLNDPARTYELMHRNNISLYLHGGRAAYKTGEFDSADLRCDWLSLAALNDLIEEVEPSPSQTYTGLILGRIEPTNIVWRDTAAEADYLASDVDFCYYSHWTARARTEASIHDHHKLVIVDELTYMLSSPFTIWDGQENPWGTADVEVLRALATEPDGAAPESQRAACDQVWGELLDSTDPVADGWLPPASAPEAPVELWGRIAAAHVPLFLIPSMMIGRAAHATGSFDTGDAYVGRWAASPQVLNAEHPGHQVRLQYFATTYAKYDDHLKLSAWVNGVEQPASILAVDAWAGDGKHVDRKNIYHVDVLISDPTVLGPWLRGPLASNEIDLRVTNRTNVDENYDNVFLVWGARLVYVDPTGIPFFTQTPIHTQLLRPEDATGVHRASSGGEGPCTKPGICEDNSAYRISHLIDGVSIAADTDVGWPDPESWQHTNPAETWKKFIKHTCAVLESSGPGGGHVRCLVDERAWVSDEANWGDSLRLGESLSRLTAGYEIGDGASVTWLVMELEDMVEKVGRFGTRQENDEAYPYLAYLPRLSRNMLGEGITFEVDTGGVPDCNGEWTVEWRLPACPSKSTYGPVGEVHIGDDWVDILDALDKFAFYQLIQTGTGQTCGAVSGPFTGSFTVDLSPTDGLRFGWEIKNDDDAPGAASARHDVGDTQIVPQYVEFKLDPPENCTEYMVTQQPIWAADYFSYYEVLTCVMRGGTASDCCELEGVAVGDCL
jgi:hypothetical protein